MQQSQLLLATILAALLVSAALAGHKNKIGQTPVAVNSAYDTGLNMAHVDEVLVDHLTNLGVMVAPTPTTGSTPEEYCKAARDCLVCVKLPGCVYTRDLGVTAPCRAATEEELSTTYFNGDLNGALFNKQLVESAKFLLAHEALKTGQSDALSTAAEGKVQFAKFVSTFVAANQGRFGKFLTKQLGNGVGVVGNMCSGGWLAPGMVVPSHDREDVSYLVLRFVANGSMKLIYEASIHNSDLSAEVELDGRKTCVVKVNKKDPDLTNPIVMADIRRETLAQQALNTAGVTKDPRRVKVEALYDDMVYRGTSIIASEFLPFPMVGEITYCRGCQGYTENTSFMWSKVMVDEIPDKWRNLPGVKSLLKSWLEAVEYLSDRGFIHHDAHAKNAMFAMVNKELTIKLIDFGATSNYFVRPNDDEWAEGDAKKDAERLRMDMYGQATNGGSPYAQDMWYFSKSQKNLAGSAAGEFICSLCQRNRDCPAPDFWTTPADELESRIPDSLVSKLCTYGDVLPYGDQYWRELATKGGYCSTDEECMMKHSKIHNSFDTVNVLLEMMPMIFCFGKEACFWPTSKAGVLLADDKDEVMEEAGDDDEDGSKLRAAITKKNAENMKDIKKKEVLENAGKIIPVAQTRFRFLCPSDENSEGGRREAYRSLGINFPDNSASHNAESIVQAFKWLYYGDASIDLGGELETFVSNSQFADFLSKALDCNPEVRYDARQLLEHPFFGGRAGPGDSQGEMFGATARTATVDLKGVDPVVDKALRAARITKLSVQRLTDDVTWPWATAATVQTNRLIEAPYVTPQRRIEIDLKTGKVFVKGYPLGAHPDAKDFVKHLFRMDGTGSLPALDAVNGGRYLWAVSHDWRFIIAPEALDETERATHQHFLIPGKGPYAGSTFESDPRPILKHGDLTPGLVYDSTKSPTDGAGDDSKDNFYTPEGHNALWEEWVELKKKDEGSQTNEERSRVTELRGILSKKGSPYERGCIIAAEHMLSGLGLLDNVQAPTGLKRMPEISGLDPATLTMTSPSELGKEAWGQCRGPQRLAGELYFIRVDEENTAETQGLGRKTLSGLAPTVLSKNPTPTGKTMRWVMDPEGSAMVQRKPDLLTFQDHTELTSVHRVRILLSLMKAVGVDTDEVWTNAASLGRHDESDILALPTAVVDKEDNTLVLTVNPQTPEPCTLKNTGKTTRRYTMRCKNPKWGLRQPTWVTFTQDIRPLATAHFTAENCKKKDPRCEILDNTVY